MKKLALSNPVAPAALCAGLCLVGGAMETQAQLTPGQKRQLNDFFGNRAEVGVILGASDAASSGSYTVDGRHGNEDLDFSLAKFGGGGEIGQARPLGDGGLTWNPVVMGSIGQISGKNDITAGPLAGNKLEEKALGLQVGGGIAIHFTEGFTLTPTIGMIYGHYDPHFNARTGVGRSIVPFIDKDADSIGVTPGIGLAYKLPMGKCTWEFGVRYTFYGTEDVSDSNFDIGGSSHIVEERVDLDVPLPAKLWNCPLHTGGYLAVTEAAGDIGDSMNSDLWATIHGRLLLDPEGRLWRVDRIGLGMSGIFADHFTGWDLGIEVTFKF